MNNIYEAKDNKPVTLKVRNEYYSNNWLHRNIIAGFPGVGKSVAANKYPDLFTDMESSDYHWIIDENGDKVCNPDWPTNYVDTIIAKASTDPSDEDRCLYICISTHKEVLDELRKRNIYYVAVVPKSKDIYIQRYIDRGSSDEFIKKLDENFYNFIKDVESSSAFLIYYSDVYISDIYGPSSTVIF